MKIVFIVLGFIFVGLGCLGIPLPVLPTTPFLMLAAICFAKGSKKLEIWFKSTKLYHKHLESFVEKREMTLKAKLTILLTASAMLLFSFGMMQYKAIVNGNSVGNIIGRITVICMIPIKYFYFFTRIKTIPSEEVKNEEKTSA